MKPNILSSILLTLFIMTTGHVSGYAHNKNQKQELAWNEPKNEHKPGIYWWWMGSAVDEPNLSRNLERLHDAGIGSVTIVPIYGVRGYESRFIDYLSPRWMDLLAYTLEKAGQLGMQVDMTTGTGWPFGGSHVAENDAARKVECKTYRLPRGSRLTDRIGRTGLQTIIAYSDDRDVLELTQKLDEDDHLDWTFPDDRRDIYVLHERGTGQKVKRAAPGNEGYVLDPFSTKALNNYLDRFDQAFKRLNGNMPRAQYHDSFEYYNANWTKDLFSEFEIRRGYDLRKYLFLFFGDGDEESTARVKSDYRETLSDLHLDYIKAWTQWSHDRCCRTRNQAHGAPANLLDLYAAADIPETEIFGASLFRIPGLRRNPDEIDPKNRPRPLINRFASSAAHVSGKPLIAAETATWLREHFKTALSQIKPEIDQLFLAGINHIFYHGNAYSPEDAAWPGWLFYASTHFEPENTIWRDLPALNSYVTRCQSILQSGRPDNDMLLYWPVYDLWHDSTGMTLPLTVHREEWLSESTAGKTAVVLSAAGFSFDFISDTQLLSATFPDDRLRLADATYRAILIPECTHMPVKTFQKLIDLAAHGATIIVQNNLPGDVPGFAELSQRREQLREITSRLKFERIAESDIRRADINDGQFLLGSDVEHMLGLAAVSPEPVVNAGIGFIRRSHEEGHYYFLANLSGTSCDGWISLATSFQSAIILDPLTAHSGIAATKGKSALYLQIQPGESLIIKTFNSRQIAGEKWRYLHADGTPFDITGEWKVDFIEGRPALPASFTTRHLETWTKSGDANAARFSGTARYTIAFELPGDEHDDWTLDPGMVCESARIRINGQDAGVLFSIPFRARVGKYLHPGENLLEIEVTNLTANLIADYDRRKVDWKIFHDINFVNIHYKEFDASGWQPMDSGLLGPVRLHPMRLLFQ